MYLLKYICNFHKLCKFILLPMHGRESIFSGSHFRTEDFDGFTDFEPPESENDIFSGLSMCVCVL